MNITMTEPWQPGYHPEYSEIIPVNSVPGSPELFIRCKISLYRFI